MERGSHRLHDLGSSPPSILLFSPDEIFSRIWGKVAHSTEQEQTPKVHLSNSKHDSGTQFSQGEWARLIVEQSWINLDTKLHTFTVLGSERPHVVTLFPKETCSCPSTTTCCHILVAKMSLGVDQKQQSQHRVNLTQLWRNARSRREKSGHKHPRPGDCDVVPAPDSATVMDTSPTNTPVKTGNYRWYIQETCTHFS